MSTIFGIFKMHSNAAHLGAMSRWRRRWGSNGARCRFRDVGFRRLCSIKCMLLFYLWIQELWRWVGEVYLGLRSQSTKLCLSLRAPLLHTKRFSEGNRNQSILSSLSFHLGFQSKLGFMKICARLFATWIFWSRLLTACATSLRALWWPPHRNGSISERLICCSETNDIFFSTSQTSVARCAAHKTARDCCAVDYMCHTTDGTSWDHVSFYCCDGRYWLFLQCCAFKQQKFSLTFRTTWI